MVWDGTVRLAIAFIVTVSLHRGIETSHPDFGGRAYWGVDLVQNPSSHTDQNGHGTHVTGIAI